MEGWKMLRDEDGEDEALEAMTALRREQPLVPGETDRMVAVLRNEGLLRRSAAATRWPLLAAAAVIVFAAGAFAGSAYTKRGSLEDALARRDLTVSDRVLLLQRAGSAYVQAAQAYADATTRADSTAVEVASQVLVGAANAVARHNLDAGMAARLAAALQPRIIPASAPRKPLIWF
jgi:hypothetical protein